MDSLVIVDFTHFKKTFSAFSKSKIIDRLSLSLFIAPGTQPSRQVGKSPTLSDKKVDKSPWDFTHFTKKTSRSAFCSKPSIICLIKIG
jgi:hypothetical protein